MSPNRWKREPLKIKVDPGLREFLHTSRYTLCVPTGHQDHSHIQQDQNICLTLPLKTSETTQVMIALGYGRPLRTRIQLLTDSSFNYVINRPSSVVGGNFRFGCCQHLKLCAPACCPLLTTFLLPVFFPPIPPSPVPKQIYLSSALTPNMLPGLWPRAC